MPPLAWRCHMFIQVQLFSFLTVFSENLSSRYPNDCWFKTGSTLQSLLVWCQTNFAQKSNLSNAYNNMLTCLILAWGNYQINHIKYWFDQTKILRRMNDDISSLFTDSKNNVHYCSKRILVYLYITDLVIN